MKNSAMNFFVLAWPGVLALAMGIYFSYSLGLAAAEKFYEEKRALEKITPENLRDKLSEAYGYFVIAKTIEYYKTHKSNNGYNQNPTHLLAVWKYCNDYAPVVAGDLINMMPIENNIKKRAVAELLAIDMPLFMFCVSADETNYVPEAVAGNKDYTSDIGITQINEVCHPEIEKFMPDDLKARPWTDVEKNIAGRYIWIRNRIYAGQRWDIMTRKRGWALYEKIYRETEQLRETAWKK